MREKLDQFKKDFAKIEKERESLHKKENELSQKYREEFLSLINNILNIFENKTGEDEILGYLQSPAVYKKYGISEEETKKNIDSLKFITVNYMGEECNLIYMYVPSNTEENLYIRGHELVGKRDIALEYLEKTEDFYYILDALLKNKVVSYIINSDAIKKLNESTIKDFKNFKNKL